MVSDEELRRIYNLFTDCWRYFKKMSLVNPANYQRNITMISLRLL